MVEIITTHVGDSVPLTDLQKKEAKEKLNKLYKEESRKVWGVFKNLESPGADLEFHFKKFPQDPWQKITLKDGEKCELPLSIARHLNTRIVKQHSYVVDEIGNRTIDKNQGEQKCQFLSTEFM